MIDVKYLRCPKCGGAVRFETSLYCMCDTCHKRHRFNNCELAQPDVIERMKHSPVKK
jgi:hypothetical protein